MNNPKPTKRSQRYPRLNPRGHEILDPQPVCVYAKVSPDGEILRDGRPRPPSLQESFARATGRFDMAYGWSEGDDNDDDFDVDINDGSLPTHTPHTEGFVDAMGDSLETTTKKAVASGKVRLKRKSSDKDKSSSSIQPTDDDSEPLDDSRVGATNGSGDPTDPLD